MPAVVGGAETAARAVAGVVGALQPGALVGTIAGGTIGAAAIGAVEAGRGLYHTGATAGGMLADYFLGGEGEESPELPSAGSTPEPKAKAKGRPKKIEEIFQPSPEATHEPKGTPGRPRSESRRRGTLSLLPGEENAASKPQRSTRSGKNY